ncbi:endonuclease/exonuclease/phosphatase family protein [Saccharopolyspora pogona]|uniref:endonuclease/exonuclease/phosphatase family protein n=1 Tax=Saccharopolyspora pogona TaxID=333966 RepID=UPI00168323EE|nr:endonuclease/exonuclease/phosphatase family protein [Saccharopolyspora pogona]
MLNKYRFTRRAGLKAALGAAIAAPLVSAALPAPSALGVESQSPQLQIVTYNLEGQGTKGPKWRKRRPVAKAMLRQAQPHIVGAQEGATYTQVSHVGRDLGENYRWLGEGSRGGRNGTINAIFYDVRRLQVVDHNTFWLSGKPNTVGSNTWGGQHVRTATWILFKDKQDGGREFYVLNTHFDNGPQSQDVRLKSAALIGDWISKRPPSRPFLVTGDFNSVAHKNPVYTRLLNRGGLVDTWDTAATRANEYGTHCGHHNKPLVPNGDRIDWILSDPMVTTDHTETNIFTKNNLRPSDHLPVQAWVHLR